MIDACTIKSNSYGLTLVLSQEADFETMIREVCAKFAEAKHFFGKTDLILRVEGRELTGQQMAVLAEAIELNSMIHIILIDEKDELKDVRMAERKDRFYFEEYYKNAKIIPSTVKKDETVESDGSILILGDVKKNSTVTARGNVVVCGEVCGNVHAGCEGEKGCFVVANSFKSAKVQIADISGDFTSGKRKLFSRSSQFEPYAVVLWEGVLLHEPLSNGIVKQVVNREDDQHIS